MNISRAKFKDIISAWDDYIQIAFHATTSGMYSYPVSYFAEALWEALRSEAPDVEDIFNRVIAELQVEDFKEAYSSPEKLLNCSFIQHYNCMHPYEALEVINKHAKATILREGFLETALEVYGRALELRTQRRNESKLKIPKPGYVYFIKSDSGAVKIGRTGDLDSRMNNFSVTLPFSFTLEHVFETTNMMDVEKMFHEMFATRRIKGEWFDLAEEVLSSIKGGEFDHFVEAAENQ